ncbi:MAG TPA: phosphate ABC transporter permease PstA [Nitrososphaerales archaeon]|nr:phosphate ABC transporter permease PstA [Nitrososphaerales archaeon]
MNARRKLVDRFWIAFTLVALVLALAPLASIIYYVTVKGLAALNISFFTHNFSQVGTEGGIANALQGTFLVVLLASAIGVPTGVLSGVYVAEYGSKRYGEIVRFLADVLVGIPSIVTGILIYSTLVLSLPAPFRGYTAFAGGVALGFMEIPIVSNTTSEALRTVPNSLREASAALGVRKWRATLVIMANALSGVTTGILLATARIAGETAPLLLTALGSTRGFQGWFQAMETMTLFIFQNATSGTPFLVEQAWGASFILLITVLGINIIVRIVTRRRTTFV